MPTRQIRELMKINFDIFTLNINLFRTGTMRKDRHVKNEALTDVVYLIPHIPKANIRKTAKDSRKAYLTTSLLSCLNFL